MALSTQISLAVTDTREQNPEITGTDAEILTYLRTDFVADCGGLDKAVAEVQDWIDSDTVTAELGEAYLAVLQAEDVDITAALAA